jgi:voltage-gated potassium channel
MDNAAKDAVRARIQPRHAIAEFAMVLWHLRAILAILLTLFLILSVAMYGSGANNVVETVTVSG